MNLVEDTWIPVRPDEGTGPLRLISLRDLLCGRGSWRVSLPRDDLELAGVQLLVCLTQALLTPQDDKTLRQRLKQPLSEAEFEAAVSVCHDWFDLDHPTQPFMQARAVQAREITPIQKLLNGLPEGNNHCLFNERGEVTALSASVAAIALFHQASNCPSFGGGFKGSLRGGAPITTLVDGPNLRELVWRNVLTVKRVQNDLPGWRPDLAQDRPTWIDPIRAGDVIQPLSQIGLIRGLFWQPARVELITSPEGGPCDLLGIEAGTLYTGFRKEKFSFTVNGTWPHPHGALRTTTKKGEVEEKFASFTTDAPAWTRLTELVMQSPTRNGEGNRPAPAIGQARALGLEQLHLLVGGYRNKQAAILERRHELMELGKGWDDEGGRLETLVAIGSRARDILYRKLMFAAMGHKDKKLPGIGVPIQKFGERLYYTRTESLILSTFSDSATFGQWQDRLDTYAAALVAECKAIFSELTEPYAMKPELIPIIAWARRGLATDLNQLKEAK